MSVKLLTEHHLEFLSLKEGCTGSSESKVVKMPNCWKSHIITRLNHYFSACRTRVKSEPSPPTIFCVRGGPGGTLIFFSYVGSGPASTVHHKNIRNFKHPKNI